MPKKRKYRRAKVTTPAIPPATKILLPVAPLMPHAQPNGTLRVTLEIPRAMVEEIVRSETRHEVQNMLRGIAGK